MQPLLVKGFSKEWAPEQLERMEKKDNRSFRRGKYFLRKVACANMTKEAQKIIDDACNIIVPPGADPEKVRRAKHKDLLTIINDGGLFLKQSGDFVKISAWDAISSILALSPAWGIGTGNSMAFLYAEMLVLSKPFHADMTTLFGDRWHPAPMKSVARCTAKCADADDGYRNEEVPETRHLKDILRGSVYVNSNKKKRSSRKPGPP